VSEDRLAPFVGTRVSVTLHDGTIVTGQFHARSDALDFPGRYAVEYASPETRNAYSHNRFHSISSESEIADIRPADAL